MKPGSDWGAWDGADGGSDWGAWEGAVIREHEMGQWFGSMQWGNDWGAWDGAMIGEHEIGQMGAVIGKQKQQAAIMWLVLGCDVPAADSQHTCGSPHDRLLLLRK